MNTLNPTIGWRSILVIVIILLLGPVLTIRGCVWWCRADVERKAATLSVLGEDAVDRMVGEVIAELPKGVSRGEVPFASWPERVSALRPLFVLADDRGYVVLHFLGGPFLWRGIVLKSKACTVHLPYPDSERSGVFRDGVTTYVGHHVPWRCGRLPGFVSRRCPRRRPRR